MGLPGDREEKAGWGAGGRRGLNSLSKAQPTTLEKLPITQSNPRVGVNGNGLCLGMICQLTSLPVVDLCMLESG